MSQLHSTIDKWANFLANEKLTPDRCEGHIMKIVSLCERLGAIRGPRVRPYKARVESRRLVCQTAMDMNLDLAGIKYLNRIAMARSLLDIWNEEYAKRFGSNYGTSGAKEAIRRNVKIKLSERNS